MPLDKLLKLPSSGCTQPSRKASSYILRVTTKKAWLRMLGKKCLFLEKADALGWVSWKQSLRQTEEDRGKWHKEGTQASVCSWGEALEHKWCHRISPISMRGWVCCAQVPIIYWLRSANRSDGGESDVASLMRVLLFDPGPFCPEEGGRILSAILIFTG